jgi:hypothetical protein
MLSGGVVYSGLAYYIETKTPTFFGSAFFILRTKFLMRVLMPSGDVALIIQLRVLLRADALPFYF